MSGIRDKVWDVVINELRETVRIHRKRIVCFAEDLSIQTWPVYFSLKIHAQHYGGTIVKKLPKCHKLVVRFSKNLHIFPIKIQAPLHQSPVLLTKPPLVYVPPLKQMDAQQIHKTPLLPRQIRVLQYRIEPIHTKLAPMMTGAQLRMKQLQSSKQLVIPTFKKPGTRRVSQLFTKRMQMSLQKHSLPIVRSAIPPHRFSKVHRDLFRERLAKKARLEMQDMQIVGVYDRVYLGLYQSISQTPEGLLQCVPKLMGDSSLIGKTQESAYLIVGKSYKQPGQTFQVVISIAEFEHVQSGS